MRRVRRSAQVLLFVLSMLTTLAVSSGTASATSAYDDTVRITGELTVKNDSFAAVDVSASYMGLIQESCGSGYYDSLTATVSAEGEYSVSKFEHGTADSPSAVNDNVVMVVWSEDGSGSLGFQTEFSTYKSLYLVGGYGVSYKSAQIYMDSGGDLGVQCMNSAQTSYLSTNQPGITAWDATVWLSTFNITYPSGYDGELAPPPAQNVAMGDSFSSGEGNSPFEYGTDEGGVNECHRSLQAYPRLLQTELDLGPTAFVACSGATTNDVLGITEMEDPHGKWNEPAQIDALSLNTKVVTITIGGNDVGFKEYAIACFITQCGPGTFDYNYIMNAINDSDFYDSLVETYETIIEQAPNAQVYVVDYPYMAVEDSDTCGQFDLTGAWAVQNQLNAVIEDAVVEGISSSRIHYVPTNYAGSPFAGRHLCTTEQGGSYFDLSTLHPNVNGHIAYKEVLSDAMS